MRCTVGDLAQARNRILANDPELAAHVRKLVGARSKPSWLSEAVEGMRDISQPPAAEAAAPDFELESIVQRVGRPIFAVIDGKVDLKGFVFQLGFDRRNPVAVDIDFLEENR